MDWKKFKQRSEKKFRKIPLYFNCYGFQIQPGTKWNPGLNEFEIKSLEELFGFTFPDDYKSMLLTINGFDRDGISIDPDGEIEDEFERIIYIYPQDYERTKWLTEEIFEFINYTKEPLSKAGFDTNQIVGFVPLYGHRALVVFQDTSLSPVVSVHQGTDVIVYGNSLLEYWEKEFEL
ncbi:SMI1/KNR4 family protein [Fluviicola taffensis]|uniref:Cell wall assembly/cell proliferation coordinating protein, KNR4 n=1 Tax=Fluviicola taffensis (strain DSM 16823 / NCIMB 13979 / RW262) TaxID=755732 RepID=F2IFE0_FLUTR|nr:SMI1/KNR4 family protein [Fluviicola taffensis]AEA44625.1 Cell wall assembly/cell proliferation coordinating protein, KNR4 [Fluviicola taffensis DSM 16823]